MSITSQKNKIEISNLVPRQIILRSKVVHITNEFNLLPTFSTEFVEAEFIRTRGRNLMLSSKRDLT